MHALEGRHISWRGLFSFAALAALLIVAPTAAYADFSGAYAPGNWTISTGTGDGSVDTSGAPASVRLIGADNGEDGSNTDFTIAAAGTGLWSFNFVWDNQDSDNVFDSGGFLLNGVFTAYGGADTSGSQTPIAVAAGDIIGYRVNCSDCIFGRGVLTISNFSAPTAQAAVPEPGTLLLVAVGAAGSLALARRRRA